MFNWNSQSNNKINIYDFRSPDEFKDFLEFCNTIELTPEIKETIDKLIETLEITEKLIKELSSHEFLYNMKRLERMRYSRNHKGLDHDARWRWKLKSLINLENKFNDLIEAFNLFDNYYHELLIIEDYKKEEGND